MNILLKASALSLLWPLQVGSSGEVGSGRDFVRQALVKQDPYRQTQIRVGSGEADSDKTSSGRASSSGEMR